jgi:Bacterial Ig-like domain (group 3)/FG-GAP-like repeat
VYQDAASGGNLHILLGNGDGSFRAGQVIPLGTGVGGVIDIGDLNGDGVPDLVVSGGSSVEAITVFLGRGDGTFGPPIATPTSVQVTTLPAHAAIADFDGDGYTDVVFSDGLGNLHLMRGDGKGDLGAPSTIQADIMGDVLTADLNGDGRPDLVISGSVLLNRGSGTFGSAISYATPSFTEQKMFGLADVNGDGQPDMVFGNTNSYGSSGLLMVAYGNGDGTFSAATAVANINMRVFAVAGVADLHDDGKARAVVAGEDGITTALGATPARQPLYAASSYRYSQALTADFNRDGFTDIAVPAENSIIILFGKADGTFTAATSAQTNLTIGGLAVADTNGDGFPDAILGGVVFLGNGDGTFSSTPVPGSGGVASNEIYLANFNGDGNPDLFNYSSVLIGNGNGTFTSQYLNKLSQYPYPLGDFPTGFAAIADFNHDGLDDIAAGFSSDGAQGGSPANENVALALSGGAGNYTYAYLAINERVGPMGAGDFDHDGCPDIAVAGSAHIFIYKGNCAGGFTQVASYAANVTNPNTYYALTAGTSSPADIAVADLDGDGNLDIVYTIPSLNQAQILYGNGDGTFTAGAPITLSHSSLKVTAVDLDGDGYPDLIFSGYSLASVVYGQPNRTFAPERIIAAGFNTGKAAIADLNVDGKPDIAIPNLGVVASVLNDDGGHTFSVFLNNAPAAGTSGVTATLTIAPEPSTYGSAAQGTASFAAVNNTTVPTGFCSILVDGVPAGTAALNTSGVATFPLSALNAGAHTVSVIYQGDVNFRTAIATATHTVLQAPTALTLQSFSNPSTTIQPVTLTANVSSTAGVPGGAVQFYDSGSLLGSASIAANGSATYNVASFSAGSHNLTASYSATTNFAASSGSLTQVVTLVPSVTTIASSTNSALFEAPVTITISVGPVEGTFVPTGTVSCAAGSANLGSVTLANGSASLVTTSIPAGTDGITCTYAGDSNFASSSSSALNITITPRTVSAVSLTVTVGGNPVTAVQAKTLVTLTAQVTAAGSPVTVGQVNFCDGATSCVGLHLVGTAQLTAAGTAVLKFIPAPGSHNYVASFAGTTTVTPAVSSATALNVSGGLPNTSRLTASGAAGNYTLTAAISGLSAPPTGTVSFLDLNNGNYPFATASLITGATTFGFQSSNLTVAGLASAVRVGDFNGDGIPDLAVGGVSSGTIVIYLANGDGTFTAGTTLQTGASTLVVADFNGDGIQDIAAISPLSYSGVVYLGKGDGTFAAPINMPQDTGGPFSMVSGDFNNDGIPDLALANESAGTATILLGNGDGTFTVAPSPTVGSNPRTVVTGDFNGDGNADLAFSTGGNGTVTVMLGDGHGKFAPAASSPSTSTNPITLAVGDFDGDGKLDLAVANNGASTVSILLGNGDGTFRTQSATPSTGATPIDITVGDFNGDGKEDIAVANESSNTVTVLLGNGDGTFADSTQPVGSQPEYVAAADFNGSGMTDLVVGNVNSSFETLLLAQETATASAAVDDISPIGTGTHQVQASYPGDDNYAASQSNVVALTAQPATTSLTLSTSSSSITYGQQVQLTATLAPFNGQGYTTDGETVTLLNGSTNLGTAALQSGIATFSTTALQAGTANVTAAFAGDTNFTTSGSHAITITIAPAAPTITFAVSNHAFGDASFTVSATSNSGAPLTYAVVSGPATISGSSVTVTGTGTVVLQASQAAQGNYTAGSQQASFTVAPEAQTISFAAVTSPITYSTNPIALSATATSGLPVTCTVLSGPATISGSSLSVTGSGSIVIDANQSGNSDYFAAPQATQTLVVNPAPVTVVWSQPAAIGYGTSLSGILNASAQNGGASVPGSFAYSIGYSTITAATIPSAGSYPLVATFTPANPSQYASATGTVTLTVNKVTPGIALAAASNAVFVGNPLVLTATVSSSISTPTGSVTFMDGSTPLGTASLSAGVATLTVTTLPTGSQTLSAIYSGDSNFVAANSGTLTETVQDLALTTSGPEAQTISRGGTANFVLSLNPTNGTTFPAPVNFSVTGLPAGAMAAFTPSALPAGSGPTNVTLSVTLPQTTALSPSRGPLPGQASPVSMAWLLLPFTLALGATRRLRQSDILRRKIGRVILCVGTALALCGLTGCGSNQQPQNYTMTITVSSGSLSHSTTATITVQ